MEPLELLLGSVFLIAVIKIIVINQIISRLSDLVFDRRTLVIIGIALALYLIFPEEVMPYYTLIWNYFIDGVVTLFSFLWDFLNEIVEAGQNSESYQDLMDNLGEESSD